MSAGSIWTNADPVSWYPADDVLDVDVWETQVVPITSKIERAGLAGNVLLRASVTGLPNDSVAVPLGLELIDRSLLGERAGRIREVLLDDVDAGIRAILGV